MSRRYAFRRPSVKILARHAPRGDRRFLDEVQALAERGVVVRVCRFQLPLYDIILNGPKWLARKDDGEPLGTFQTIEEAVAAGDRYDGSDAEEIDDDPRGAA